MTNRKSWFGWVKKLFISESKDKQKKWRWSIGRMKQKQYPTIAAPKNRTLIEANAEQRKHALAVAIASAAAAEAAVAAAHAAAEVVKLTGASRSYSYLSKGDRSLAAIHIQSAYRAHLARKALRALKGVIRLQAIIRGEVVRRHVSRTLKHFPSKARNQEERRNHIEEENYKNEQIKQFPKQRTWDCSSHTREDIESIWSRKQEAIVKRERMRQYSSSQRERKISQMVEESLHSKGFRRDSSRTLGEWLHKETSDWDVLYKQPLPSNIIVKNEVQEQLSSRISIPRKSFSHVKRCSIGDESSMPNSPVFPKYMAVTESSKAKVRSMSTPRQRGGGFLDICSNQNEPHKEGNPSCSSHVANFHMHI